MTRPWSIYVPLQEAEKKALLHLSDIECRHAKQQARFLIVEGLIRRGLLSQESLPSAMIDDSDADVPAVS